MTVSVQCGYDRMTVTKVLKFGIQKIKKSKEEGRKPAKKI